MNDHPSESQNDGLGELDAIGLDDLDLGEGPFDPGPLFSADENAQMVHLEITQEVNAELDYLETLNADNPPPATSDAAHSHDEPDEPELTPLEAQRRHGERFIANLNGPKLKTARKSKLSPRQVEIIEYRKSPEGKPLWNEYQLAKRWEKAEADGRTIIPRKSLKNMTPEEKTAHQSEQAAARKRKQRAKIKMTQPTT